MEEFKPQVVKQLEEYSDYQRKLSDEQKIKGGAEKTDEGRLEFTKEQVEYAKEEMGAEKQSRREKMWEAQLEESKRTKVLNQLEELLQATTKGLNKTGWAGENLDLPRNLRSEINNIVKDTINDPMAGRCRKIRDLLNSKYHNLADEDVQRYRKLLNDNNLEKYFNETDNLKSIRERKHWLEKIQIK